MFKTLLDLLRCPYLAGYCIPTDELVETSRKLDIYEEDDGAEVNVWYYLQRQNPWMYGYAFEAMGGDYHPRYMLVTKKSMTDRNLVEEVEDIAIKEKVQKAGLPTGEWVVLDNPPVLW